MRAIRFATASAAAMIAGLFAPGAWATCYVIYGADQQVIYRSQTPPVDLSRNLHETLPQVAPGGTLVFWVGYRKFNRPFWRVWRVGSGHASAALGTDRAQIGGSCVGFRHRGATQRLSA